MPITLIPSVSTLPIVPLATVKLASSEVEAGRFDLGDSSRKAARARLYGEGRENYPHKGNVYNSVVFSQRYPDEQPEPLSTETKREFSEKKSGTISHGTNRDFMLSSHFNFSSDQDEKIDYRSTTKSEFVKKTIPKVPLHNSSKELITEQKFPTILREAEHLKLPESSYQREFFSKSTEAKNLNAPDSNQVMNLKFFRSTHLSLGCDDEAVIKETTSSSTYKPFEVVNKTSTGSSNRNGIPNLLHFVDGEKPSIQTSYQNAYEPPTENDSKGIQERRKEIHEFTRGTHFEFYGGSTTNLSQCQSTYVSHPRSSLIINSLTDHTRGDHWREETDEGAQNEINETTNQNVFKKVDPETAHGCRGRKSEMNHVTSNFSFECHEDDPQSRYKTTTFDFLNSHMDMKRKLTQQRRPRSIAPTYVHSIAFDDPVEKNIRSTTVSTFVSHGRPSKPQETHTQDMFHRSAHFSLGNDPTRYDGTGLSEKDLNAEVANYQRKDHAPIVTDLASTKRSCCFDMDETSMITTTRDVHSLGAKDTARVISEAPPLPKGQVTESSVLLSHNTKGTPISEQRFHYTLPEVVRPRESQK